MSFESAGDRSDSSGSRASEFLQSAPARESTRSELESERSDFSPLIVSPFISTPANYSSSAFDTNPVEYSIGPIANSDSLSRVDSATTVLIIVFEPFDDFVTLPIKDAGYQAPSSGSLLDNVASTLTSPATSFSLETQGVRIYGPRSELSSDIVASAGQLLPNVAPRISEAPATLENRPSDANANKVAQLPATTVIAQLARPADNLVARVETREPLTPSADIAKPSGQAVLVIAGQRSAEASRNTAGTEMPPVLQDAGAQASSSSQSNGPVDRGPEVDAKQARPVLAGLLGDIGQVDAAALEQGLQQLLRDFDAVGGQVVQQAADAAWVNWVAPAIAASVLASEVARRRMRRTRLELAAGWTDQTTWSWFPQGDEPRADKRS